MNKKPVNVLKLLLFFDSLLFIILYCILSNNARLASDDFYYLWLKNTYGAWGGMIHQYEIWSGRWTAHSVACGLLSFSTNRFFLIIINLATLTALFLNIRSLLKKIFTYSGVQADNILLPGLTIMLITSFFFSTYSIGESWFWYIIIITYMWSLISFLYLLNFIFSQNRLIKWIPASIAAIYIGGASESFALIFIVTLLYIIYNGRKDNTPLLKDRNRKVATLVVLILASFLISYLAPGTDVRQSQLPSTSISYKVWAFAKSYVKYFVIYLPQHAGYLFLFSFPWLLFGTNYLKGKYTADEKRRIIRNAGIFLLSSVALILIPTTYVMSESGPDRALLLISLITSCYTALIAAISGTYLQAPKNFRILSAVIGDVSILILLIIVYVQAVVTGTFASAYDKRMEFLLNEKEKNTVKVVKVDALPEPGMLYWEEISADTSYFVNKHLKQGLELPFGVIIKSD